MRQTARATVTVVLLLILTVIFLRHPQPARAVTEWRHVLHPPTSPPAGWVHVRWILVASGCSGCTCGSTWQPGSQEGLMEKPGDRRTVGRNEGPTSSPWGSTADPRAQCPESGEWAAGTWYHNAVFPVNWTFGGCRWEPGAVRVCDWYGSWGSPTWEGGNFAENDDCCADGGCDDGDDDWIPCTCPAAFWSYSSPSFSLLATDPPYPLVVGQDPDRVGTTVTFRVSLGPATHTWYGPECPACPAHTETVRDRIDDGSADIILTQESRDWIVNELGLRYYGAEPKHPDWYGIPLDLYDCRYEGNTHVCTASAWIPAEDPGEYDVNATIVAGLNGPRLRGPYHLGRVKVWMLDTTLWP
ncbi:MAG TPA: hypothetical protein EYH30_03480 [Anaerolineales bacterium]|nr:hypothetical protein [Anaerolineales bacterium]